MGCLEKIWKGLSDGSPNEYYDEIKIQSAILYENLHGLYENPLESLLMSA